MFNNIIITASNSLYFDSLLTLINGIHTYAIDCVDKIFIYNLGLGENEIEFLQKLKFVSVLEFPTETVNLHPKFLEPKSHVYKLFCLENSVSLGKNIFWMDSGVTPINPMCEIFDKIEKDDIFLVADVHLTRTYTHSNCVKIMSANDNELDDKILSSGMVGFKSNGIYRKLIEDAFKYSIIPGCVDGDEENHRHDQSVLSILSTRYNAPKQDIEIYGYWTDVNRTYQTAIQNNAIIFVHRRGYDNKNNLIYEN